MAGDSLAERIKKRLEAKGLTPKKKKKKTLSNGTEAKTTQSGGNGGKRVLEALSGRLTQERIDEATK